MSKRKSLSKRARFEVFKRDGFSCQYCGRTPPQVLLHVDHIVPVSAGGSNDESNLITACADCNLGKSNVPIGVSVPDRGETIAKQRELAEQTESYNDFLMEQHRIRADQARELGHYWAELVGAEKGFTFNRDAMESVKMFLKHLPYAEVLEAVEIATARHPAVHEKDWGTFKYFCGICWNKIRGDAR